MSILQRGIYNFMNTNKSCIWVFRLLNNEHTIYLCYQTSKEKALRYVYDNEVDITYIRKFVTDKKLLNVGAPVSCAWVLFDKSNGDATSKLYLWVHNSKRKALNQYNEHKKNDSLSKLSYPQRYFFEK